MYFRYAHIYISRLTTFVPSQITYITSFGGEDELQPHSKILINFKNQKNQPSSSREISSQGISYADKVKQNLEKLKQLNNTRDRSSESPKKPLAYQRRDSSYSRSRSRSRSRTRRHSRSSYRKRSGRRRSYSRSRSRSRRRSTSRRQNSRSKYRSTYNRHSRRSYSSSSTSPPIRRKSSSSSTSTTSSSSKSVTSKSRDSRSPLPRSRSKSFPVKDDPPIIVQPAFQPIPVVKEEPMQIEPPIKKYYGRRREDQSSDDEMNVDEEDPTTEVSQR